MKMVQPLNGDSIKKDRLRKVGIHAIPQKLHLMETSIGL